MEKYIMYININKMKFSIKIIKQSDNMEPIFDTVVENEKDVFRYNDNYWMSYSRAELRKFAKEYLTREIDVMLNITRDINDLRDKI